MKFEAKVSALMIVTQMHVDRNSSNRICADDSNVLQIPSVCAMYIILQSIDGYYSLFTRRTNCQGAGPKFVTNYKFQNL